MRRDPPKSGIIKNCVFILTCLNFNHLESTLHWCNSPIETFFHCSQQFLNLLILMPFSSSATLFHLFHTGKMFPFKDLFHMGKQKKVAWGKTRWIGRVGKEGSCHFGSKTAEPQCGMGRYVHSSPIIKWANMLNESSEKFTEAQLSLSQQHQLVHWYRWVPRTLT